MTPTKAVAAVVGAICSILLAFHIDVPEEVKGLIITVGTALFTYFSPPNKPKRK